MGFCDAIDKLPMALKVGVGALVGIGIGIGAANIWGCEAGLTDDQCQAIQEQPMLAVGLLGTLWLRALQLVVLPLLFSNMIVVANAMSAIQNASKMGRVTIMYYLATTFIAVTMGIGTGLLITPFISETNPISTPAPPATPEAVIQRSLTEDPRRLQLADITTLEQIVGILFSLVPDNIFRALADFNLLGCISFALVLGLVLDQTSLIVQLSAEVNEAAFIVIGVLIKFTPIGVCFLIAPSIMILDPADVFNAVSLVIGIPLGLLFQCMIVYPLIYNLIRKQNPFKHLYGMLPAIFTAMGTSSSAATLPVTQDCVQKLGISETVSKFVLTVGATANMDGSAIYFPIAVIWLAKTVGHVISTGDVITLFFMCTLAAIGASPIPQSGLVLVKLIADSINITQSDGSMPALFAVVIALDPFFDRGCTMVNIIGDSVGAACVEYLAPPNGDEVVDVPMAVEVSFRANASLAKGGRLHRPGFDPTVELTSAANS